MLEQSIVRILNHRRQMAGTGFLVEQGRVITTAQVVLAACKDYLDIQQEKIKINFPMLGGQDDLECTIEKIIRAETDGSGDVAVLKLDGPLPTEAQPAPLVSSSDLYGHEFLAYGVEAGGVYPVTGVLLGIDANDWMRIKFNQSQADKQLGRPKRDEFLGAAIWDRTLDGVAGMVTSHLLIDPSQSIGGGVSIRTMRKGGLVPGSNFLAAIFPQLLGASVGSRGLPKQGQAGLELSLNPSHTLTQEEVLIERLLEDLAAELAPGPKDGLHVCSALNEETLSLVLVMQHDDALKLLQLFEHPFPPKDNYRIQKMALLEGDFRTQQVVSPTSFRPPAAAPKSADKSMRLMDETYESLRVQNQYFYQEMGRTKAAFITATEESIRDWYNNISALIGRDEHAHTNKIGKRDVGHCKDDIRRLEEKLHDRIQTELTQNKALWWHEDPKDQKYMLIDYAGRRVGPGAIEIAIRRIADEVKPVMVNFDYACGPVWNTHPYEWSDTMREHFAEYGKLWKQAVPIYEQFNKVKKLRADEQSAQNARQIWS